LETAITVTGLRPGHFYNVRVIAIGSNNFQAQSEVLRLRTYGRDGRPILGSGRVPSNISVDDQKNDNEDDLASGPSAGVGIEAVLFVEGSQAMVREPSASYTSQRRNTGGRKHSPSVAAADQSPVPNTDSKRPEESMHELTEKFEAIRRDTDEVTTQMTKDKEEFEAQIQDLTKERDEKKHTLREKDRASEKLKREVHQSEQINRSAQARKSQKEKVLREKRAEIAKVHDDISRWKKEIEDMKSQQETWDEEEVKIQEENEIEVKKLQDIIQEHQHSLIALEEDIRIKGLQIKELEEERQKLLGTEDDDVSREQDAKDKQEDLDWESQERNWVLTLNNHSHQLRHVETAIHQQQGNLTALTVQQANNPIMYHGNSSGVDFDPTGGQGKAKSRRPRNRKSRTSTISSPIAVHPIMDSPFPSASAYNNLHNTTSPSFAPGPYIELNNDTGLLPLSEQIGMSDEEVRLLTAGAPLSPTATALLPSNIFADDDPPSPRPGSKRESFGPSLYGAPYENDQQSPDSSSRSASLMSSPQNSSHNLAIYGVSSRDYPLENDRRSLNSPRADFGAIGSPAGSGSEQPTSHRGLGNLLNFSRSRGKTMQEDGPALGSLKQGQSQSFPRSTEEPEVVASRLRRISFSSPGWGMPTFLRGTPAGESSTQGNAPAPARNLGARSRRGFNMFSSSTDDTGIYSERDPSSPRPVSIASSDLPRPSTDSAPFGWGPPQDNVINRNSPLATNWSHTAPSTWSRNPSRRPSLQHGSTTALTTGLATEEDEIFKDSQASPPPGVGVIGTRPSSSHKPITPKLNPAAPAFKGFNFRGSKSGKDKGKGKEKTADTIPSMDEIIQNADSSSPAEPRQSRDTPSVHTQHSMTESYESLERTSSNAPSETTNPSAASAKEKESAFKQLLRKGSASKFSITSFRNKESGLFSAKKGGSSAANSDRNASVERDGSLDEYGEDGGIGKSVDSVTSSPMIGSTGSGEWTGKQAGTPKEGRKSMNWSRFGMKKKGRESSELDRSEAETTGTEDET
jgi:hypothetical protein